MYMYEPINDLYLHNILLGYVRSRKHMACMHYEVSRHCRQAWLWWPINNKKVLSVTLVDRVHCIHVHVLKPVFSGLHLETFLWRGGGGGHSKLVWDQGGARLFSMHMICRGGVWRHAPPGNFCILDSLRLFWCTLRHYILNTWYLHLRQFLDFMRVIILAL